MRCCVEAALGRSRLRPGSVGVSAHNSRFRPDSVPDLGGQAGSRGRKFPSIFRRHGAIERMQPSNPLTRRAENEEGGPPWVKTRTYTAVSPPPRP